MHAKRLLVGLAPTHFKPAAVLMAVKDKPYGRPGKRAFLDRHCARRRMSCAGRDGRMGSAGAEQKDGPRNAASVTCGSMNPGLPTQNSEDPKTGMRRAQSVRSNKKTGRSEDPPVEIKMKFPAILEFCFR